MYLKVKKMADFILVIRVTLTIELKNIILKMEVCIPQKMHLILCCFSKPLEIRGMQLKQKNFGKVVMVEKC